MKKNASLKKRWKRRVAALRIHVFLCSMILSSIQLSAGGSENAGMPAAMQQKEVKISGKVTDSKGMPLPGVNIVIKGSTKGVSTDAKGSYSLAGVPSGAVLVFTLIGMQAQEIPLGDKTVINVEMKEGSIALDEVVAVGYGTKTRSQLINSISTVSTKELTKASVPNLESALTGRVSGVFSRQTTGEPGQDNADIKIRGFGSALVVVDGIPGRSYANLDPNEIESISVLKDAASASVYGMQGANGVILVTTKHGKVGKPELSISTRYGIQHPYNMPQVLSTDMWQTLVAEYRANQKLIANPNAIITAEDIQKRSYAYNTSWYDALIQNAPITQSNISATGGNESVKFFFSGGLLNQKGIWKTDATQMNRFNVRSNVDAKITKSISATLGVGAVISMLDYPGTSASSIAGELRSAPYIPVRWPGHSKYYASPTLNGGGNPVALADPDASGYTKTQDRNYTIDFSMEYKPSFIDGLSFRGVVGYNSYDGWQKNWVKNIVYMTYAQDLDKYILSNSAAESDKASLALTDSFNWGITMQGFINYKKSFGDHNVNSSVIFEQMQSQNKFTTAGRGTFPSTVVDLLPGGLNDINKTADEGFREYRSRSVIGRFSYDYSTKYLFEFNFRYDGAQYFASKWGFFPSLSAGWFLSKERFMEPFANVVTEFKLRGSWGQLGDLSAARSYYADNEMYYYQSGYKYPGNLLIFGDRTLYNPTETVVANSAFTWSKSTTVNFGFDSKWWNGLLTLSADIFSRNRTGLPAQKAEDNAGALKTWYNLNSDETRGFEVALGHKSRIGELTYSADANMSWSRTKNIKVEHGKYTSGYGEWRYNSEGTWNNIRWDYKYTGRYTNQTEIDDAPMYGNTNNNRVILPGDIKLEDWNGDGYINSYDQRPMGRSSYPEMVFGANISMGWKGVDFSMFWQGAALSQFTLGTFDTNPFAQGNTDVNAWSYFADRWRKADYTNPNSKWISGKYPATRDWTALNINNLGSDFWYNSGTYVRLKNIELGYTLPKVLTQKLNISSLRFYVNAYNLLTFNSNKYFDPEQREGGWNLASYPQVQSFNLGLNMNF